MKRIYIIFVTSLVLYPNASAQRIDGGGVSGGTHVFNSISIEMYQNIGLYGNLVHIDLAAGYVFDDMDISFPIVSSGLKTYIPLSPLVQLTFKAAIGIQISDSTTWGYFCEAGILMDFSLGTTPYSPLLYIGSDLGTLFSSSRDLKARVKGGLFWRVTPLGCLFY
ncbi:MAG: hypothetical protein OEV79_07950 [candidate division WOR-3 bacterium]|nr:hypothetical protein [candidate division WOR-3 bacterium]